MATTKSVTALLLLMFASSAVDAQVENPTNGHFYFIAGERASFEDSRLLAEAVGGALLAVNDDLEQLWIADQVLGLPHSYWLGLSDEEEEGAFLWDSGEPFDYQNWQAGEPDNGDGAAPEDAGRLGVSPGRSWYDDSVLSGLNRPIIEYLEAPTPPVSNLEATPQLNSVSLSWQNPLDFDIIEIYRGGRLIDVAPGSATEAYDPYAEIPTADYWVIGRVGQLPATPALISSQAIDLNYILYISQVIVAEGQLAEVAVGLSHVEPAFGWSYGACHEATELELLSVDIGSGTTSSGWGGQGPAFYSAQLLPGGFTVGVVVDFDHPTMALEERVLDIATYQGVAAVPFESALNFCDSLGSPPVEVAVISPTAQSHLPVQDGGSVEIRRREFIRADTNSTGTVDIADPLFLAAYLFSDGETPACLVSADVNSDLAVDVSDVISSLMHLFSGGPAPAAPYPLCGSEPSVSLDCAIPLNCP